MNASNATRQADGDFPRQLRHAGLRATRPRLLVLRLFAELGGHRSADEVMARLRAWATPLPCTSVYNVVNALAAYNLLTLSDVGSGCTLYELTERWHHHFVCRQCGKIIDVPCLAAAKPCLPPQPAPGEVGEPQIIFRGRRRACLEARSWRRRGKVWRKHLGGRR